MKTSIFTLTWIASLALVPTSASAENDGRIYQGTQTTGCQFPQVVGLASDVYCTGVLAHPRVIISAAHCGGGRKKVHFGNSVTGGSKVLDATCTVHPSYQSVNDTHIDWAYCVLDEAVDLPLIPPAVGCELDNVSSGTPIIQIGVGGNGGNSSSPTGVGPKRWGRSQINRVEPRIIDAGGKSIAGCPGDSGGPALVQLNDGTWRTVGILSTMYTPRQAVQCGSPNVYSALARETINWIEQGSKFDITPCFDASGNWEANENCGNLVMGEAPFGAGTWSNWCADTQSQEWSSSCGDAWESDDDDDSTDSDDEDDSTTPEDDDASTSDDDDSTTPEDDDSSSNDPDDDESSNEDDDSGSTEESETDSDDDTGSEDNSNSSSDDDNDDDNDDEDEDDDDKDDESASPNTKTDNGGCSCSTASDTRPTTGLLSCLGLLGISATVIRRRRHRRV